jgi:hypothetical protein
MLPKHHQGQRGQILVLFAGGLVTILAIAALVIDLGNVFLIRRQEQNAADPGAVAAARHIRPTPDQTSMVAAACFYAHQNGFFGGPTSTAACIPANDSNGTSLTVNYPPSSAAGPFAGRSGFVEVIISRPHNSYFAGLIGMPSFSVATSAVAAFNDGDSNTSSLVALDPGDCAGGAAGHIAGGANVNIHPAPGVTGDGGYVHVNQDCATGPPDSMCGSGSGALKVDGGGSLTAPKIYVHGTCQASGTVSGDLTEGAVQIGDPLAELQPPNFAGSPGAECGIGSGKFTAPTGAASKGCLFKSPGTVVLAPGVYYGGWDIRNNVVLELQSGIYVIAGGGVTLNAGGSITSATGGAGTPAPVMIFNTDNPSATCPGGANHECQQSIDFTASARLSLRGMDSGPYKGILLWNDGNGSDPDATITIGGQSDIDIAGTIYNPKGLVKLDGGSDTSGYAAVQIISWRWDIVGGANLDMPYDPNELYHLDQKGLVR